jgi:pimeloyl-ACP methyl ester carboxylesterase
MDITEKSAVSKDGTTIAFEQSGNGPFLILVAAALSDRSGTTRLANRLAQHFTVINYDRRGRGKSADTLSYAIEHEVEDIEALIDASSGSAYVFGSSSGAVLALETASRLGCKIKKLFLYEPPFIVDESRPSLPDDLSQRIGALLAAGRRAAAVKLFFTEGVGIPNFAVNLMRIFMPGWSKMAGMAHTLPYDLAILSGTQQGKALPAGRWACASTPTLVAVGSRSKPFFHSGAKALIGVLPNAQYCSMKGLSHASVLMSPQAIASAVEQFFLDRE